MSFMKNVFPAISTRKQLKEVIKEIGVIFGIITTWFAVQFFSKRYGIPDYLLTIIGGLSAIIGTMLLISYKLKKRLDVETGSPAEDEFTKKIKLHAGHKAYQISIIFWIALFIINYKAIDALLGSAILGSIIIYCACLWHFKSTAGFDEK